MWKLRKFIKGYGVQTVVAPLFKMLEALFELLVPFVVANIIDVGIKNADKPYIWKQCLLLLALALIGMVCSLTAQFFAAKASLGFGTALRSALFRHIGKLSYSELDTVGTPTLVTRMTSDINQVQNGLNLTLRLLLRCPFIIIGAILCAFAISPKLTLLFLLITVAIAAVVYLVMRVTVPVYQKSQNTLERVTRLTRENYVGARVVRAFSRGEDEIADFTETNNTLKRIQMAAGRISALMNPLTYTIVNLGIIGVLLFGGREVDAGTLTQGEVIALVNYMTQILTNLLRMADLVISITRALASGRRVQELLNLPAGMTDAGNSERKPQAGAAAVEFRAVDFTYAGAGAPSLSEISFRAAPGETVGVIGGTGCGKTTLIDLIPRFYDASQGEVLLYGQDVRSYPFAQLRRTVGIVPQRAVLFTGTVRDNLRWGKADATDEQIWRALEIAQAADFIRAKPEGLDTLVETGGRNFSGGQRQRLTIARALVGEPDILILDDSASALDFATDLRLRRAIAQGTKGTTVFLVSQRASTVRQADRILVLDDGCLVGDGTHESLLRDCSVYREICLSQLSKEEVSASL